MLATPEGAPLAKAENAGGILKVAQVEKLVESEVKRREGELDAKLKEAKEKSKAGDATAAVELLRPVLEQKCMFPSKAKDAAKDQAKDQAEQAKPTEQSRKTGLLSRITRR